MGGVLERSSAPPWRCPRGLPTQLPRERTLIMGILNLTPDSFSDGGRFNAPGLARARAEQMLREGASIIDVGGESTRPGAERVDEQEERRRILATVAALSKQGIVVSVDTMRASVAAEAVEAGALIINDVSGGLADPEMWSVAAQSRTRLGSPAVYIAMHWRAHATHAMSRAAYGDVVSETVSELTASVRGALDAGVDRESIVVDPGFGFSKTADDNWELLHGIEHVEALGFPLLCGVSRKRFVSALGTDPDSASAAISAVMHMRRAWAVRVHDVPASLATISVMDRLMSHDTGACERGLRAHL